MSVNRVRRPGNRAALAVFAVINIAFLSLAFMAGYVVRAATTGNGPAWLRMPADDNYPLLADVRSLLEAHYIGDLPSDQALEFGAVRGLVAAVNDPYTVFVEPQTHELDSQALAGEYGGIGATVTTNEAGEIVLAPYRDSPAARAGLLDGDVLLAVDDTEIRPGTAVEAATALIRGPIHTQVRLTVRHPSGQEVTISLTRQRFEIPSVQWRLADDATIGIISISRFSGRTAEEVKQAIVELAASGAARYVLDLRNNGGGILEAAVDTAAQFLDGGVVMYETQRAAPEKTYSVPASSSDAVSAPLVVLVNANTASAAEIVAGALLDRSRAPLVGQQTYGKGSVQLVYDLSGGASLHVTAYRWYTPSRRDLEASGLPPTYVVEPATDGGDAELQLAIQLLNGGGATQTTPALP